MNSKNFVTAGIVGGIVYFFLGWLVYGVLLMNFMAANAGTATGVERTPEEMVWWSLVLGNLLCGFLLSYIFCCVGKVTSASQGAKTGAWIGLLVASAMDFNMYGTTNTYNLNASFADIVAFTFISAVAGAAVARVLAKAK